MECACPATSFSLLITCCFGIKSLESRVKSQVNICQQTEHSTQAMEQCVSGLTLDERVPSPPHVRLLFRDCHGVQDLHTKHTRHSTATLHLHCSLQNSQRDWGALKPCFHELYHGFTTCDCFSGFYSLSLSETRQRDSCDSLVEPDNRSQFHMGNYLVL